MKILSEIPTERAMKELSKTSAGLPATRQAVLTMSLWKDTLVKSLRLMAIREKALQYENSIKLESLSHVDKTILDYMKAHPDFNIDFK